MGALLIKRYIWLINLLNRYSEQGLTLKAINSEWERSAYYKDFGGRNISRETLRNHCTAISDIWGIDIKKQNASIPKRILNQLKKTVVEALEISVNQQTYRGRTAKIDDDIDYIWDRKEGRNNTYFYQINRESKLYKFIREKMSDSDYNYLEILLTEIERNIPTQQMYIDKSNEAIFVEETDSRFDDVFQIAVTIVTTLKSSGTQSYEDIIDGLMKSEPFCKYPQLRVKLIENFKC